MTDFTPAPSETCLFLIDIQKLPAGKQPGVFILFGHEKGTLTAEEGALEVRTGGVATEVPVAADYTVAGHEDEEGIVRDGVGNGTRCGGTSGGSGQGGVGGGAAGGYLQQELADAPAEGCVRREQGRRRRQGIPRKVSI